MQGHMRINLTDYFKKYILTGLDFEIDVEYKYASKTENHYEKENAHKLNLRVQADRRAASGSMPRMVVVKDKQLSDADKNKKKAEQKAKAAAFLMKEAQQERILQDTESQLIRMCYTEEILMMI